MNTHSLIRGLRKRVRLGGQETTGSVCVRLTFGWFRKVHIQLSCYPDRDQKLVLSPRPGSPGREAEREKRGQLSGHKTTCASQGTHGLTLPPWGARGRPPPPKNLLPFSTVYGRKSARSF